MQHIKNLIIQELDEAREKFPPNHSPHEGYAVLLEEIEELQEDMNSLQDQNQHLWNAIKTNSHVAQSVDINKMK